MRFVDCSQARDKVYTKILSFAKTNLRIDDSVQCKIVVLLSADKLTIDAQSALRRCLELFAHTTRFFVIVGTTTGLMRPILSRFCSIHVPVPESGNLHKSNLAKQFVSKGAVKRGYTAQREWHKAMLVKTIDEIGPSVTHKSLFKHARNLYNQGFYGRQFADYYRDELAKKGLDPDRVWFSMVKMGDEVRNEELYIAYCLRKLFLR